MEQHIQTPNRKSSIDLGLAVIEVITPAGKAWTADELSDVLGCSRQRVYQIEKGAIKKIRRKLEGWQ